MFGARSFVLAASCAAACALGALLPSAAPAQTISLSLNVFYATPSNAASGGTWELVAKSSNFGIAGLEAHVKDISSAVLRAPRATVNGNDAAGFNVYADAAFPTYRGLIFGQAPISPLMAGEEQGAFYGVGTLTNGSPNFPAKVVGTNTLGPAFTSLTAPHDIPWAISDPFASVDWLTGARMASGTFATGVTPSFVAGSSGNVFTSLGTSTAFGSLTAATVSAIVRTNFIANSADYNHNGIVDAADYIIWRNSNGQTVTPGTVGDGDGNGIVNGLDYNLWRSHFGLPSGSGSGSGTLSTAAVPEPRSAMLFVFGALLIFGFQRSVSPRMVPVAKLAVVPVGGSTRSVSRSLGDPAESGKPQKFGK